jgi:predicted dehydrogenase
VSTVVVRPRLGFLGVGWIGRARLEAVAPFAEVEAIADPAVPGALASLDELLELDLDGVVIATPSALHAEQTIAALEAGRAVFCQKPLGRNAADAARVVEAARAADRLLAVDLSYRSTAAAQAVRRELRHLGHVYAAVLVFHNAYGPDRPWFYDPQLSGGGCVTDLGIHLVDLALWSLDWPEVSEVSSRLLHHAGHAVEDYAVARLDVSDGALISLACSWNLAAGRECVIEASFYGEAGGAALRNVDGSFYDLRAERFRGVGTEVLAEPPDEWGGRVICEWARRVARGDGFDPEVERVVEVQRVLDRIYGRQP